MALRSENISDGQSHRARLREMKETGQLRDPDQPRPGRAFSDERTHYVAVGGATTGPNGTHRSVSSSTPRSHGGIQSVSIPRNSNGGQATAPRPDGHVRPPSPRSQGTMRFGGTGRRVERPAAALQNVTTTPTARPVLQATSSTTRAAASLVTVPRAVPTSSTGTTRAAPAASSTPRTSATGAPAQRNAATTGTAPPSTAPIPGPGAPAVFTRYQPEDHIQRGILQNKALLYAATPGTACDNFVNSHPQAAAYLREARRRIINEVTALVLDFDHKQMDQYIKAHQERKWMLAAALKAAKLLEYADKDEISAHYNDHENHKQFLETAKVLRAAQQQASAITPTSRVSSGATVVPSSPSQAATSTAHISKEATTSTPAVRKVDTIESLSSSVLSVPAQVEQGNKEVNTPAASTSAPPRATIPQSNVLIRSAINGATSQPNGSVSTASSRSSLRSAATDVTVPPTKRGTLNVTVVDSHGKFLHYEQIPVAAPVNGSATLTSLTAEYDPRTFFAPLKTVAEREPVDRTRGHGGAVSHHDDIMTDSDEEL